jgi:anti-sigma B factor antagonist
MNITFEIIKISPVSTEKIDYTTIIFKTTPPQKIDIDNSKDLWIYFKTLISGGARKIFIDLKNVQYIDSSGIGVFINSAKLIRKQNGDIVLANVSEEVRNIFRVINLDEFIKIYNTDVEAINSFRYVG